VRDVLQRKSSLSRTLAAVLWSFFGVRKGRDHDRDLAQLNPIHVAIVGVLAGVAFVITLIVVVRVVIGSSL
jgi:hypothetical protein